MNHRAEELGVKEYNILEAFGEGSFVSEIRVEIMGSHEVTIDFMTLCPK